MPVMSNDEAAVEAAVQDRDFCYGLMRRSVPDLERPAVQRAPLSAAQAAAVSRFLDAEDRLNALRAAGADRLLHDALA